MDLESNRLCIEVKRFKSFHSDETKHPTVNRVFFYTCQHKILELYYNSSLITYEKYQRNIVVDYHTS